MRKLTNNGLKIIACLTMLVDHIGYFLFPSILSLRIIGRIAFPIFAFCIATGCLYTKNKLKRFLTILGIGIISQLVTIKMPFYGNVLLTFSFSIILIYLYLELIKNIKNKKITNISMCSLAFIAGLIGCYLIMENIKFDYGFGGAIFPLIVVIFSLKTYTDNQQIYKYQTFLDIFSVFIGSTIIILLTTLPYQFFSYFSLIFIGLYNRERGKINLKYFFYLFYPLHVAILYLFSLIF